MKIHFKRTELCTLMSHSRQKNGEMSGKDYAWPKDRVVEGCNGSFAVQDYVQ